MASNSASVQNSPERPRPNRTERTLIIQPLIPPSEAVEYTVLQAGGKIGGLLGLPAAQLVDPPAELTKEIAVWLPSQKSVEALKPDDIVYESICSVRYRGNGHTVVVATFRLSPAAAKLPQTVGNADRLANGTIAGTAVVEGSDTPNVVVFTRSNFAITVASDLPLEEVKR